MIRLPTFEYRQQVKFAESVQAEVLENLERKDVAENLGEYALQLQFLANELYVPNVRHGVISAPKKYRDTNHTPFIGIKPEDRLTVDYTLAAMSPTQSQRMVAILQDLEPVHSDDPFFTVVQINGKFTEYAKEQGDRPIRLDINVGGFCNYGTGDIQYYDGRLGFVGRSVVAVAMRDYSMLDCGMLLTHELAHILQMNIDPTYPLVESEYVNKRLRDELEAFYVGVSYARALVEGTTTREGIYWNHRIIDDIRRLSTDEHGPFDAYESVRFYLLKLTCGDNIRIPNQTKTDKLPG